ncbi:MAG: A24 family peptidase [Defluviitaleaceae bacterium]|nr:A24 family peptidase [Defluviitaleaceae bacterium]MCL2274312.1 A24 family peptidase [Defluviitaleaceae bacterium]
MNGAHETNKTLRAVAVFAIIIFGLVLIYFRYGITWMFPLSAAVLGVLLLIGVIDYDIREIPDTLVIALIPLGWLAFLLQPHITLLSRGIGFLAVSLPMLGIALVKEGAMGGGDIKLMAVCGFLLGWQNTVLALFIALLLAGVWIFSLVVRGQSIRKRQMAFAPALCSGVFVALLYGTQIVEWYISFIFI